MTINLLQDRDHIDLEPYLDIDWNAAHLRICEELARCTVRSEAVDFWYTSDEGYNRGMHREDTKVQRLIHEYRYGTPPPAQQQLVLVEPQNFRSMHKERGRLTEASFQFPYLRNLVEDLPFETLGRVVLFENTYMQGTPKHIDLPASSNPVSLGDAHFMLLDPGTKQPLWYTNRHGEQVCVETQARFFNTSCTHWTNPHPYRTYLIRVDGRFTEDFINKVSQS